MKSTLQSGNPAFGSVAVRFRGFQLTVAAKYPDDYSMQIVLIKDQVDSYIYLQSFQPADVPTTVLARTSEKIASRYPKDYSMQKVLIQDQVESYIELHK